MGRIQYLGAQRALSGIRSRWRQCPSHLQTWARHPASRRCPQAAVCRCLYTAYPAPTGSGAPQSCFPPVPEQHKCTFYVLKECKTLAHRALTRPRQLDAGIAGRMRAERFALYKVLEELVTRCAHVNIMRKLQCNTWHRNSTAGLCCVTAFDSSSNENALPASFSRFTTFAAKEHYSVSR